MLARYRTLLQHRPFRRFWLGFTFSVLGDSLTRVALTWYVYEQTRSVGALGWLAFWYAGPVIVGGLVAGWLLDRFDRRTVMILDNVVRGVAMATIPALHALGILAVWHVYAAAALYGLLMMIALAGSPTLIPSLVERGSLDTANALETLSWTLGGVVGPALAGFLILRIGAPNVLLLDVVSYFAFALSLSGIRVASGEPARRPEGPRGLGQAVRLLRGNKVLVATTVMFMAFNIGGDGFISVWLPVLADRSLGGGPAMYGTLLSVWAAGEVAGALLAGGRRFAWPLGRMICAAQALAGTALALLLFSDHAGLVITGLALFGAFSAPLTIWAQTLRMQVIPEALRGRTFALLRTLMLSGSPIGGALAGLLFPLMGMAAMVASTALLVGLPGLLGYQVRAMRQE